MSRVKDQFHSEIIANSADAEWERALDGSLAEQYPNYRLNACCLEARIHNLLERAERLGRELDEFNKQVSP